MCNDSNSTNHRIIMFLIKSQIRWTSSFNVNGERVLQLTENAIAEKKRRVAELREKEESESSSNHACPLPSLHLVI